MLEWIHPRDLRHLTLHALDLTTDTLSVRAWLDLPFQSIQSLRQLFDISFRWPSLHGLAGESTLSVRPRTRCTWVSTALIYSIASNLLAPTLIACPGHLGSRCLLGGRIGDPTLQRCRDRVRRKLLTSIVLLVRLLHGRVSTVEVSYHLIEVVSQLRIVWLLFHLTSAARTLPAT